MTDLPDGSVVPVNPPRTGDMAMPWVRTIDEAPRIFATGDQENSDRLLY